MSDMERLKKLLLTALSTDHDNEALIALRKLRKAINKDGRDIHWFAGLLDQQLPFTVQQQPVVTPTADTWEEQLAFCVIHFDTLTPKYQEFIVSIMSQKERKTWWYPTPKQEDYLEAIYNKASVRQRWGI